MSITEEELRKFLTDKEKEDLDSAKKYFEESIEIARKAGVPEDKIIKSKEDLDNYFMN